MPPKAALNPRPSWIFMALHGEDPVTGTRESQGGETDRVETIGSCDRTVFRGNFGRVSHGTPVAIAAGDPWRGHRMSLVRPSLVVSSCLVLVAALSSIHTPITYASSQVESARITAAANVTLRAMPSADAAAVAQLPLGTELVEAGPAGLEKTWVRVRLTDGREGWLQASLARPFDRNWPWPAFDRIIADRLNRKGDGFPSATELVAFIERVAPEYTDRDGRGRIELARLRATSAALSAIPFGAGLREPYASWLAARKGFVTYDEPGGRWMLTDTTVWDVHGEQSETTSADEIGWFAVGNGLAGECEGHLPCYLVWRNRLHGEYLRRHPSGKYAAAALGVIKATADLLIAPAKPGSSYDFDKKRDCRDVALSIDVLTTAVQGARVDGREAAIASLAAVRKTCGAP